MTNRLAIAILIVLALFFALDHWLLHWGAPLFLARQGLRLIEWLAFWR
ncbi:hypothetical protein ruthe_01128 [Rubellimicrobium thermophilum DSM 16684]|uniref:Glyceraldehyde-3-phosphate dehydrogenase n=1 Tax=Rubellimicrobium thermophilum DSM 16684 TaxID=1123069 RepID=S9SIW9_9RHOB|nr:hypothetical protein [Rubellimicrobium thermophilum]EPX86314.1 hypothetical protein ruthe_01128 [Rubellimicrobium thermophilum DSM 16684]